MKKCSAPSPKHGSVAVVSSALVRQLLETCASAGVEKVIAADHHGMIFLLSDGPEQIGCIVHRDDSLKYTGMKTLASEVNAALVLNCKGHPRRERITEMNKEAGRRWMRRLVRVILALAALAIPINGKPVIVWLMEGAAAVRN